MDHLKNEKTFQSFLKAHGGHPIGCLVERNVVTRGFDAVTPDHFSVATGKKLAPGTKVKLWVTGKIIEVPE
jgi:hypothetical protein